MATTFPTDHATGGSVCRRWRPAPVHDEDKARRRLIAELTAKFPQRTTAEVEREVDAAWESLADSQLRDFVPVLAGKAASERLRSTPGQVTA